MKPTLGQLNATQTMDNAIAKANMPKKYQEFQRMFKEKTHEKLSGHQDWNYEFF